MERVGLPRVASTHPSTYPLGVRIALQGFAAFFAAIAVGAAEPSNRTAYESGRTCSTVPRYHVNGKRSASTASPTV